jgi:23S rRNA pseudouridine1911/1915/1917 synthase
MLFARTSKAAARLADAMRRRGIEKWYLCRSQGVPEPESGEMWDYLAKDERENMSRVVRKGDEGAKEAQLRYSVVDSDGQSSVCEVELVTGRPHQIRVQFAARGFPLLGDAKYGGGGRQLALWAFRLVFVHPTTKRRLEFNELPPAGF